jgi:hypothetical protein
MALEDTPLIELRDRYVYLVDRYITIAPELIKKLEDFGRIKKELELITAEFIKRNATQDIQDQLKKLEDSYAVVAKDR